jgi:hypothetical protein
MNEMFSCFLFEYEILEIRNQQQQQQQQQELY